MSDRIYKVLTADEYDAFMDRVIRRARRSRMMRTGFPLLMLAIAAYVGGKTSASRCGRSGSRTTRGGAAG